MATPKKIYIEFHPGLTMQSSKIFVDWADDDFPNVLDVLTVLAMAQGNAMMNIQTQLQGGQMRQPGFSPPPQKSRR